MRFNDLVGLDKRPPDAVAAHREAVDTDSYLNQLSDDPRNNGFVTALVDRRRARRMKATRRGFLRGTLAAAAATTAVSTAQLFGPARRVEAQSGVVGSYPRRILQYCPPYNSGDNCQPGCGSSPICTDCCGSDGFFRNDPGNGYTLYAGGCGDGDIADGWLWRFSGKCGNCAEIEYRCSDGYVQTDTGPAPFICRTVTECVPLAEGEAPGETLPDAARDTNWRPAGALEVAIDNGSGNVSINGWIADGSGVPIQMRIRANNQIVHFGTAALPRPDIAATRPGAGTNVGFAVSFPIEPGQYEFCVDALAGVLNARIGCVNLAVGSGGSARGSGSTGTIRPPAPAPGSDSSDNESPTSETGTAASGAGTTPAGAIVLPDVTSSSPTPVTGAVQVIRRSAATTGFVSGWAGDVDTGEPVFIEVVVDGESAAITQTDLPRPDVVSAFEGLGTNTGFAISFPLPAEASKICVDALGADDGRRVSLGCRDLGPANSADEPLPPEPPSASGSAADARALVYGAIDAVEISGTTAVVRGWTFDPNDRDRVVDVRVASASRNQTGTTGEPHADAQRTYGVDSACGFSIDLELTPGIHSLSVSATASDGREVPLGQQVVVIE